MSARQASRIVRPPSPTLCPAAIAHLRHSSRSLQVSRRQFSTPTGRPAPATTDHTTNVAGVNSAQTAQALRTPGGYGGQGPAVGGPGAPQPPKKSNIG
jgi:hypothetical protein